MPYQAGMALMCHSDTDVNLSLCLHVSVSVSVSVQIQFCHRVKVVKFHHVTVYVMVIECHSNNFSSYELYNCIVLE